MKKFLTGVIVSLVLASGIAFASIPDSGGTIHGCYKSSGGGPQAAQGALRVIDTDASQQCVSGETSLNWNQTGPPGPQGNPGPQGSPGVVNLYFSRTSGPVVLISGSPEVTVENLDLPAGSYLITAKINVDVVGQGPSRVTCFLRAPSGPFDDTTVALNGDQSLNGLAQAPIALNNSETVSLACSALNGNASLYSINLSATEVTTISQQ